MRKTAAKALVVAFAEPFHDLRPTCRSRSGCQYWKFKLTLALRYCPVFGRAAGKSAR
jgi:hypothetical protein